ncbi:MAG: hypothetical protein FJW20_22270 [Acidimicrobiia bacterium]|nr:hypothetical protein [Acidimicrobiia bacterium]
MAASPVIIDDGGSTRIKQAGNANPDMDRLMTDPHTDFAAGTFPANIGGVIGAHCQVIINSIDKNGRVTRLPASADDPRFSLTGGQTAEIISEPNQRLEITLGSNGVLTLNLSGPHGDPPLVEARQIATQRRYIVANSGSIRKVRINDNDVFAAQPDTVYTMVRLG